MRQCQYTEHCIWQQLTTNNQSDPNQTLLQMCHEVPFNLLFLACLTSILLQLLVLPGFMLNGDLLLRSANAGNNISNWSDVLAVICSTGSKTNKHNKTDLKNTAQRELLW